MGYWPRRVRNLITRILPALILGAGAGPLAAQDSEPPDLLTNAQQVLDLGIEGARQAHPPVRLRAVVTYATISAPWFYAQDATAGILVVCSNLSLLPKPGQWVEITGQAGPGLQAPHVLHADYRVIGTAPLPAPRPTNPARLAIGEEFGQWVSLEGNVLDFLLHPQQLSLLLQDGEQHFVVNIRLNEPTVMPPSWLGARVEVQGVCWTEARADGVPTSFRIHSPGTNTIKVLRNGPTNPFAWPLRSVKSLASLRGARDERVRVEGSATLLLPGQSLFLRDPTGAIQAQLLKPISAPPFIWSADAENQFSDIVTNLSKESYARLHFDSLAPGDLVEVIGTPSASGLGLILSDARYRRLGPGAAPVPVKVSGLDFLSGLREDDLVTWQGRLIDRETHQTPEALDEVLVLRDGGTTVRALFNSDQSVRLPELPRNALLEVTGVCSSEAGEWEPNRAIRLLLRSKEDVRIIAQPPPWESWRVGRLLLLGGALGIGALAWIWALRSRVARRTSELAQPLADGGGGTQTRPERVVEDGCGRERIEPAQKPVRLHGFA